MRVELSTEAYDQPTSAYGGRTSHASASSECDAPASACARARTRFSVVHGELSARAMAQLYGQECLIDVTTFEVGGSSVRHFFMSFISAPSLLLFESRFDCWLLVTPLPFPGYIFSRWFRDSLRNFCNREKLFFSEAAFSLRRESPASVFRREFWNRALGRGDFNHELFTDSLQEGEGESGDVVRGGRKLSSSRYLYSR